ncbi:MAG: hypothetical protein GY772_13325 [bacterium]|nr:hypothetical protein [bacterium]
MPAEKFPDWVLEVLPFFQATSRAVGSNGERGGDQRPQYGQFDRLGLITERIAPACRGE